MEFNRQLRSIVRDEYLADELSSRKNWMGCQRTGIGQWHEA
jgi:hypothetical protein